MTDNQDAPALQTEADSPLDSETTAVETNSSDTPNVSADPKSEWTIMIYMSSDNDLTHECIRALAEIRSVAVDDPDRINVIAQIDPQEPKMRTKRFVINKEAKTPLTAASGEVPPPTGATAIVAEDLGNLKNDSVEVEPGTIKFPGSPRPSLGSSTPVGTGAATTGSTTELNMADPQTLFDFVSRCQEDYPARHYMLVLDGHAAGVEEGFLLKDQNPPGSMSLEDLTRALRAIRDVLHVHLDVLGMDSCLMNMLEISYQFKELAEIMIGSQGLVPGRGWPFAKIVAALGDASAVVDPEDLAKIVVKNFIDSYLENSVIGGLSVDIGALRVANAATVTDRVNELANSLVGKLADPTVQDQIILSHWRTQSFNGELYVDLWDFSGELKKYYQTEPESEIFKECSAVQDAVDAMRVESCFSGIDYQHAHGLSIYFPWSEIFKGYLDLNFSKHGVPEEFAGTNSNWVNFLLKYLDATRRETLGGDGVNIMERSRRDPPWKRDPPYLGPGDVVHSMRNPPREYPKVVKCVQNQAHLNQLLNVFSIQ